MKKLFALIGLLFTTSAYAGTISLPTYISNNDVTIANLQTTNTTVANWANGNVEGGTNLKAGSIVSKDLSDAISIVKFRDEAFNDFTFSGMLPVTSVSLTSNISAGVSYVRGIRIELTAQAHTYTATKDTYVYINVGGFYNFSENSTGSTSDSNAPTPAADNLLLAKVVTSGTAITSVTDSRVMAIQVSTTSTTFAADYRNQAFVSRDTSTTFHVEPGNVAIANTLYVRTADTSTKTISTGTNWIEGAYPTGMIGRFFFYAYNDTGSSWDFKFSSADPVYSDSSSNTGGVLRYYTSGGTTYRAIGWGFLSADVVQSYEWSNFSDTGAKNMIMRRDTTADSITGTSYNTQMTGTEINFYATGKKPVTIDFLMTGSESTGLNIDGIVNWAGATLSDSEHNYGSTAAGTKCSMPMHYVAWPSQGIYKIKIQTKVNAGTFTANNKNMSIRED